MCIRSFFRNLNLKAELTIELIMETAMSIGSLANNNTLSSNAESNFLHMPVPNFCSFGVPSDLHELNLPTCRDVFKYYFFRSDRSKTKTS